MVWFALASQPGSFRPKSMSAIAVSTTRPGSTAVRPRRIPCYRALQPAPCRRVIARASDSPDAVGSVATPGLSTVPPQPITADADLAKPAAEEELQSTVVEPAMASKAPADQPGKDAQVNREWVQEVLAELKDTSKFGKRGEGWFIAQLLVTLLVIFPPAGIKLFVDTAGWLMVLGGFAMIVAGQQSLGQNLTPLPQPRDSNQLVVKGIYSYVRHPMYGGLTVAAAGLTLATGNEVRLILALVAFFVLSQKASYEERLLEERHGADYAEYRKKTKKLIPFIF